MATIPKLENSCVVAVRDRLLRGNAQTFHEYMKSSGALKGGNEHYVFDDWIFRDVIGYSIVRYFFMFNATVYGGFVPSHYSGLPWTDIDIMFPPNIGLQTMGLDYVYGLPAFLQLFLGIERHCVRMRQHNLNAHYGVSFDVTVMRQDNDRVTINVDICTSETLKNRKNTFLPVTIGSCLHIDKNFTTVYRSEAYLDRRLQSWPVHMILDLLKQGSDVKFAFNHRTSRRMTDLYREYYWYRIHKKKKCWNLLPIDGKEPDPYSDEQLEVLIQRITQMKVELAAA